MEAAERAKIDLSSLNQVEINIPYIIWVNNNMINLKTILTRKELEGITSDLISQTIKHCDWALSDAKINKTNIDKIILVGQQTRMPAVYQAVRDYFGKEPSRNLDPAAAVALGAAIQASILTGEIKRVVLLDVTPQTLGIETLGGITTKLIHRNTTIPTRESQTFSTTSDGQTSVVIRVIQGERALAKDNKTIGVIKLLDIPPAPKGIPLIKVVFDVDVNGVFNIKAKELGTGKEVNTKIEDRGGSIKPTPGTFCYYGRWLCDNESELAYGTAIEKVRQNKYNEAIEHLKKSITFDPNFIQAHQLLSETYSKMANETGLSFIKRLRFQNLAKHHLGIANNLKNKINQ
jgi:molecular chaperone DnaK